MFSIFNYIFGDSACYFLGMIVLIRLLGTLAQTRVGLGRLHTLVWGHVGSICLAYSKILYFVCYFSI